MKEISSIIILMLVVTICSGVVYAGAIADKEMFKKLFSVEESKIKELFHESFLKQVPVSEVNSILDNYKSKLGSLKEIKNAESNYTLIFENGTAPAAVKVNQENKIVSLWFGNYTLKQDSSSSIIKDFKELKGKVSLCIMKNNQEKVLSYNEDQALASGSTFKLFVLKGIYDHLASIDDSWDKVLKLNDTNKSLPSGMLQNWPEGNPVTLKTLSNLMIAISDNTAADHLIDYAGRENIESYITDRNKPFLKTGELFKLKYAADEKLQNKYIKADIKNKRKLLKKINDIDLDSVKFVNKPTLVNKFEWFFTTEELCRIIYELKDAEEITINPGLADKNKWHLAGYKGGSEPGVLQFTHILQKNKGDDIYTVSVTINNPDNEVESNKISELTMRLITLIAEGKISE